MALALAVTIGDCIVVCTDENSPTENDAEISRDAEVYSGVRALIAAEKSVADNLLVELSKAFADCASGNELDFNQAIHRGLRAYKKRTIDEYFDGHFGCNYEEFIASRNLISEVVYTEEIEKARNRPFNAELIIASFIDGDEGATVPNIAAVDEDWEIASYSGFYAIGDGDLAAHYHLRARGLLDRKDCLLDEAIFSAFEAKLFAEKVASVGSQTTIAVYSDKGPTRRIDERGEAHLEVLLRNYGLRPWSRDLNISIPLRTE